MLTLFQLLVIVGIENYFLDKIKNKTHQIIVEILTLGVTHLLIYCVGKVYDGPALYICYDWYPHLSWMFGYFALGSFIMRHQEISKLMNGKVYTLCLLFFCVSSVVDVPHISITSINLHSLAGIYCSLYLFKVCFTEGKAIEYLKRIGVKTLQIYILHLFFGMKLTQIGDYLTTLVQGGQSGFATSLVIQLLLSLSISIIIIELSLIAAKIIKTSKLCSFLMLGE